MSADVSPLVTLPPIGAIPLTQPRSWSARVALDQAYGAHSTDAQKVPFICAAALALCMGEGQRKALGIPAFKPQSADIIGYGVSVIDHLVGRHNVIPGQVLWRAGYEAVAFISGAIPREEEVEAAADFSGPRGAASS